MILDSNLYTKTIEELPKIESSFVYYNYPNNYQQYQSPTPKSVNTKPQSLNVDLKSFSKNMSPRKTTQPTTSLAGRGVVTPKAQMSPIRKFVGLQAVKSLLGTYLTKKY